MSTVTFDTHKFVKQLEAAGASPQLAEAFVTAQKEILSDALDSTLVTKADLKEVKTELKADLASLKVEMATVRGDIGTLKWMIGALFALAAANFAKQFF